MNSPIQFKLAYRAITNDLLTLCEYIDPCSANGAVFSHRTFELFLRTCTELENLWRYILRDRNHAGPDAKWNIHTYQEIERSYGQDLSSKEVTFVYWKPDPIRYWKPFDNWLTRGSKQVVLPWCNAYNRVKHDRDTNFHEASMENLIASVAALHIGLQTAFGNEVFFHQPIPRMFSVSGLPETFLLFQRKP